MRRLASTRRRNTTSRRSRIYSGRLRVAASRSNSAGQCSRRPILALLTRADVLERPFRSGGWPAVGLCAEAKWWARTPTLPGASRWL